MSQGVRKPCPGGGGEGGGSLEGGLEGSLRGGQGHSTVGRTTEGAADKVTYHTLDDPKGSADSWSRVGSAKVQDLV